MISSVRKPILLPILLGAAVFFAASTSAPGQSGGKKAAASQAEVTFLQGKAEVLSKGEPAWKALRMGAFLSQDDEVRTGDRARLEIRLPDRSLMRFDQQTTFKVKGLLFEPQDGSREVKMELSAGRTWANVRRAFGPKKTFEVASANAVAGVRDTIWRMNVDRDRAMLIRVYEGTVEVYNPFVRPEGKPEEGGFKTPREVQGPQEVRRPYEEVSKAQWEQIVLTQMMQVVIPATGRPEAPTTFRPEEDQREEWVLWNQERDRATTR